MPAIKGKEATGRKGTPASGLDIKDMILRMLVGLMFNFLTRTMKARKARKKALRKMEKLAGKGKEIPDGLRDESIKGLSRRGRKKASETAAIRVEEKAKKVPKEKTKKEKAAKEKKKVKKGKLVLVLAALAVGILAARAAKAQKLPGAQF